MITVVDIEKNLLSSLYYFLRNEIYTKAAANKTLRGHFPLLADGTDGRRRIIQGYPDDLRTLSLPTISLTAEARLPGVATTFYPSWYPRVHGCSIWGFSGGETSEPLNKKQRIQLKNDIHSLLEQTEYTTYYSDTPLCTVDGGEIEISDVTSRTIPQIGELGAEKYRFVVDFNATVTIEES